MGDFFKNPMRLLEMKNTSKEKYINMFKEIHHGAKYIKM